MADAHLAVVDGGLSSTVQDRGRPGHRRSGVPVAGALDPVSMGIANALVGNDAGAATVEVTLAGPHLVVEATRCRVALAGAPCPMLVNDQPVEPFRAHELRGGDELRIGTAPEGVRAYLAVAGGFAVAPVLGSRSTHVRSGMGGLDGGPLRAGAVLPLRAPGQAHGETPGTLRAGPLRALPREHRPRFDGPVHVLAGPQRDAFTDDGWRTLLSGPWVVSARADRMGVQLDGPAVGHVGDFNIVSDAVVPGCIQVPGNGRPIVLLADCQTTGGYPKIATVVAADLHRLGQRRPGDPVEFRAVDEAGALELRRAQLAWEAGIPDRLVDVPPLRRPPSTTVLLTRNLIGGVV